MQLYGDYFINREIRIPFLNKQYLMESKGVFLFVAQSCVPQHGNRCPLPGYPKREHLTRSYYYSGGDGGLVPKQGLISCWRGCYWGILLKWLNDFYFGQGNKRLFQKCEKAFMCGRGQSDLPTLYQSAYPRILEIPSI